MTASTSVAQVCRHCGVEITLVNYALGPEWRHDPRPHHFGSEYLHCKQTVAEPEGERPPLGTVQRTELRKDAWMMQRIAQALDAIRHADHEGLETELDLIAFAEDVLARYAPEAPVFDQGISLSALSVESHRVRRQAELEGGSA